MHMPSRPPPRPTTQLTLPTAPPPESVTCYLLARKKRTEAGNQVRKGTMPPQRKDAGDGGDVCHIKLNGTGGDAKNRSYESESFRRGWADAFKCIAPHKETEKLASPAEIE